MESMNNSWCPLKTVVLMTLMIFPFSNQYLWLDKIIISGLTCESGISWRGRKGGRLSGGCVGGGKLGTCGGLWDRKEGWKNMIIKL